VVLYIFQQAIRTEDCRVYSAINRPCVRGYVYVEAMAPSDAALICRGSLFYRGEITVVSIDDAVAILGYQVPSSRPEEQCWVRIKRGIYTGDLAFLLSSQKTAFHASKLAARIRNTASESSKAKTARIWVIPRIREENFAEDHEKKPLKRKRSNVTNASHRPPARLFDPAAIKQRRNLKKISDSKWQWKNQIFVNGLLELQISDLSLNFMDATPTQSELQAWAATTPENDHRDDLLTHCIKKTLFALNAELWVGDRVEVLCPNYNGSRGRVKGVTEHAVTVVLIEPPEEFLARPADLRRVFEIGDFVRITSGTHEGSCGWIVQLKPTEITRVFLSELGTNREVISFLPSQQTQQIDSHVSWNV
jgi:ribosomal protein L24